MGKIERRQDVFLFQDEQGEEHIVDLSEIFFSAGDLLDSVHDVAAGLNFVRNILEDRRSQSKQLDEYEMRGLFVICDGLVERLVYQDGECVGHLVGNKAIKAVLSSPGGLPELQRDKAPLPVDIYTVDELLWLLEQAKIRERGEKVLKELVGSNSGELEALKKVNAG